MPIAALWHFLEQYCLVVSGVQGVVPVFKLYITVYYLKSERIPVAARSKGSVYGLWLAGIASSNSAEHVDVSLLRVCVLSGRGLCDGLNTRLEGSYRVWCVQWV